MLLLTLPLFKYLFTVTVDQFKTLGDTTVLTCEMFTSGCLPSASQKPCVLKIPSELTNARFRDADGNRKRTFCVSGIFGCPHFSTNRL